MALREIREAHSEMFEKLFDAGVLECELGTLDQMIRNTPLTDDKKKALSAVFENWGLKDPMVVQWPPDGQQILFEASAPEGGNHFIYVVPSQGGVPTRLIPEDTDQATPTWLPDGEKVVYSTVNSSNLAHGLLKI